MDANLPVPRWAPESISTIMRAAERAKDKNIRKQLEAVLYFIDIIPLVSDALTHSAVGLDGRINEIAKKVGESTTYGDHAKYLISLFEGDSSKQKKLEEALFLILGN